MKMIIGKSIQKAHIVLCKVLQRILELKSGIYGEKIRTRVSKSLKISTALLWAEARLGELLNKIDKKKSYTGFQQRNAVLPPDINKKQSHYAQQLGKEEAAARERQGERTDLKHSGKFPESRARDKVVRGYLMVLSSRNLSMSDLRKRTLRSSLIYRSSFSLISFSRVPIEMFRYSAACFFERSLSSLFIIVIIAGVLFETQYLYKLFS